MLSECMSSKFRAKNEMESEPYRDTARTKRSFTAEILTTYGND